MRGNSHGWSNPRRSMAASASYCPRWDTHSPRTWEPSDENASLAALDAWALVLSFPRYSPGSPGRQDRPARMAPAPRDTRQSTLLISLADQPQERLPAAGRVGV